MVRLASLPPREPVIRLPHPYLTPYFVTATDKKTESKQPLYQVTSDSSAAKASHETLHGYNLTFTEPEDPKSGERPHDSNNTPWGRARRSPSLTIHLSPGGHPTLGQAWLVVYIIFTVRPGEEFFRLQVEGPGSEPIKAQLKAVCLAIDHPTSRNANDPPSAELLVLRSTFWQGAGSPFGARPVWVLDEQPPGMSKPVSSYPPAPLDHQLSNIPDTALCWHPRRPPKPRPGSVIYSRWIPHLKEDFNMVVLDYQDKEHLGLFHTWQNDPRVSQGWNEEGSLEYHRDYLRKIHEDPHQIAVLARFDDVYFGYFEIYWAKV
jgi:N5-hydroxy-L-ornithine N5-transacylase